MNLSLELRPPGANSLQSVVTQFETARREPDSAVRAIHHQPASEGIYAGIPAAVDPRLKTALAKRGIDRLYCHQADAFDQIGEILVRGIGAHRAYIWIQFEQPEESKIIPLVRKVRL